MLLETAPVLDKTPHTRSQAVGPRWKSLASTSPGGSSLQFNLDIMFISFNYYLHLLLTAAASTWWATLTTPVWPCPMLGHQKADCHTGCWNAIPFPAP